MTRQSPAHLRPILGRLPTVPRLGPAAAFEALIAASWVGLLGWSAAASSSPAASAPGNARTMNMMAGMGSMPGMTMDTHPSAAAVAFAGLPMWTLMTVAMMLPGALPALAYVASHSFRWRRLRATGCFAGTFLAVWVGFGAVALTLSSLLHANASLELALALAVGATWQLSAYKRRAMRDCHRSIPLPPAGRAATVAVARFGAFNGRACVRSCWPSMVAMVAVPAAQMPVWMAILTVLMTGEKLAGHPRMAARMVAIALGVGAVGAAVVG